jgi:hypothetical protein
MRHQPVPKLGSGTSPTGRSRRLSDGADVPASPAPLPARPAPALPRGSPALPVTSALAEIIGAATIDAAVDIRGRFFPGEPLPARSRVMLEDLFGLE